MSLGDTLKGLGANTSNAVLSVLEKYRAGEIDRDAMRDLVAVILETAGAQAETVGVVAFSAKALAATGTVQALKPKPKGEDPASKRRQTIAKSLDTVLAGDDDALETRLGRLGRVTPIDTGIESNNDAMSQDRRVEGWTRGLGAKPCTLCQYWADGAWHKLDHRMPRHPGCGCVKDPSFKTIENKGKKGNGNSANRPGSARTERGGGLKPKQSRRR